MSEKRALPGSMSRDHESWLAYSWRPAMAWQYFSVCLCDFIIFPVLSTIYQAMWNLPYTEWHPITLQGGGLYHVAMGAIVGVATWQRTREKLAAMKADPTNNIGME